MHPPTPYTQTHAHTHHQMHICEHKHLRACPSVRVYVHVYLPACVCVCACVHKVGVCARTHQVCEDYVQRCNQSVGFVFVVIGSKNHFLSVRIKLSRYKNCLKN